jgi:hypothetical protein
MWSDMQTSHLQNLRNSFRFIKTEKTEKTETNSKWPTISKWM